MSEGLSGLFEFGLRALGVTLLMAVLGGLLSVQVVLNRVVFVSAAIAQVAAAGIAAGLLLGLPPLACSAGAALVAVAVLSARLERARISAETTLGILYAAGAAASILLVAKSPAGHEEVMHLLEGNLLFATDGAVWRLAVLTLVVGTIQVGMRHHFVLVGFDPDGAQAAGYRVGSWRLALFACIGAAVAAGMEYGGILLTFADLVLPGAIGLSVSGRIEGAMAVAVAVALGAHGIGIWASYVPAWDLPPAPTIVALLVALYGLASLRARWARDG